MEWNSYGHDSSKKNLFKAWLDDVQSSLRVPPLAKRVISFTNASVPFSYEDDEYLQFAATAAAASRPVV